MINQKEVKERCLKVLDQLKEIISSDDYHLGNDPVLNLDRYCDRIQSMHGDSIQESGPINGVFRFELYPIDHWMSMQLFYYSKKGKKKTIASGRINTKHKHIDWDHVNDNRLLKKGSLPGRRQCVFLECDDMLLPVEILLTDCLSVFELVHFYVAKPIQDIICKDAKQEEDKEETMDTTKAAKEKKD